MACSTIPELRRKFGWRCFAHGHEQIGIDALRRALSSSGARQPTAHGAPIGEQGFSRFGMRATRTPAQLAALRVFYTTRPRGT